MGQAGVTPDAQDQETQPEETITYRWDRRKPKKNLTSSQKSETTTPPPLFPTENDPDENPPHATEGGGEGTDLSSLSNLTHDPLEDDKEEEGYYLETDVVGGEGGEDSNHPQNQEQLGDEITADTLKESFGFLPVVNIALTLTELLQAKPVPMWTLIHSAGYTGEAEAVILMLEDVEKEYNLVEGAEYLTTLPILTDNEGLSIGGSAKEILVEAGTRLGLMRKKESQKLFRSCTDIEEIWKVASCEDLAKSFVDNEMDCSLEVLEGLMKGNYFYGNSVGVVDYYVLALVNLLEYSYDHIVKEMLKKKPRLANWVGRMKMRPNVAAYMQRTHTVPISLWRFQ